VTPVPCRVRCVWLRVASSSATASLRAAVSGYARPKLIYVSRTSATVKTGLRDRLDSHCAHTPPPRGRPTQRKYPTRSHLPPPRRPQSAPLTRLQGAAETRPAGRGRGGRDVPCMRGCGATRWGRGRLSHSLSRVSGRKWQVWTGAEPLGLGAHLVSIDESRALEGRRLRRTQTRRNCSSRPN
jgi:hypothetical protein